MFKFIKEKEETTKKIVVIGAGVSGLVTGIHALNQGYQTTILEKNETCGGKLNTSKREYFNYFPKYINGVKGFNYLLREIGINKKIRSIKNLPILKSKKLGTYVMKNELQDFEFFLKYNSKDDDERIKELLFIIKNGANYQREYMMPYELSNIVDKVKQKASDLFAYIVFRKYGEMTIKEYVDSYNSEVIKELLNGVMIENQTVVNLFITLASFFNHNLGKLNFDLPKALEEIFLEKGGKLLTGKECSEFVFDKLDTVKAVKTKDNEMFEADYFISATDPYFTFEQLLKKKYKDPKFYFRYDDYKNYPLDLKLLLAFKANKEIKFDSVVLLNDNLKMGINYTRHIKFYKATRGKDYLYCTIEQNFNDYEYLETLAKDEELLKKYYLEIVKDVKEVFKEEFSDYDLTCVDILSPLDVKKEYNAYFGSATGFINTKSQYDIISDGILPSVKNVILSSSWLSSTSGILNAMINGKFSILRLERIIKNEK